MASPNSQNTREETHLIVTTMGRLLYEEIKAGVFKLNQLKQNTDDSVLKEKLNRDGSKILKNE
jgi:hypothetical protein